MRTRLRRQDRARRGNGSFDQLEAFISYKARWYGLKVKWLNPRDTARRCAFCGHIEKANRKSQDLFLCRKGGHTYQADLNAALNISQAVPGKRKDKPRSAPVNRAKVSAAQTSVQGQGQCSLL